MLHCLFPSTIRHHTTTSLHISHPYILSSFKYTNTHNTTNFLAPCNNSFPTAPSLLATSPLIYSFLATPTPICVNYCSPIHFTPHVPLPHYSLPYLFLPHHSCLTNSHSFPATPNPSLLLTTQSLPYLLPACYSTTHSPTPSSYIYSIPSIAFSVYSCQTSALPTPSHIYFPATPPPHLPLPN